jgi:CheY-like chemotaxis protein
MAKNILVASPQPAFGELLRLSLEESGRYRVRLVQSGREALSSAEHIIFTLAILDAGLTEPPIRYVAQGLRDRQADIRLLVIPSVEGTATPEINAIRPDGVVSQPFYAPSLLETIDELAQRDCVSPLPIGKADGAPVHASLQDASLAAHHLEKFLEDSTAPGVMVIHTSQPWVAAGQLNQEALTEVANLLSRYSETNEGVDLARYVHLHADGGEYLIYATPLIDTMVLALVYMVTTPLTVIRAQAGRLARELREAGVTRGDRPVTGKTAPAAIFPEDALLADETETDDDQLEAEAARLADLLAEMPGPDPNSRPQADQGDWVQATQAPSADHQDFLFPWELEKPRSDDQHPAVSSPPPTPSDNGPESVEPTSQASRQEILAEVSLNEAGELSEELPPALQACASSGQNLPPGLPVEIVESQPPLPTDQTRPIVLHTLRSIQQVEPIAPTLSNLAYTCVLLPRLQPHELVGVLAERLADWLPQICLAYSWRLSGLLIHPEYLQWTVQVAPAISPGNVVRLIRQQISRKIYTDFPQFEVDNPSGDFWAAGYLIISGFQPPSQHLVQDYIHQTRKRQGAFRQ